MTRLISGLPSIMPAGLAYASTSIFASGQARRRLRISGVVSSASPIRRSETTRMRDAAGRTGGGRGIARILFAFDGFSNRWGFRRLSLKDRAITLKAIGSEE